jgi:hypothetical protein
MITKESNRTTTLKWADEVNGELFAAKSPNRSYQSASIHLADYLNPILAYNDLSPTFFATTSANSVSNLSSTTVQLNASSSVVGAKFSCTHSFASNPNLENYFLHTIGSSFYNGSGTYTLQLTSNELKDLCQIIKKLFVKNVIGQINRHLNEYLTNEQQKQQQQPPSRQASMFGQKSAYIYRSYSEVLALITISMLRDVLMTQQGNGNI